MAFLTQALCTSNSLVQPKRAGLSNLFLVTMNRFNLVQLIPSRSVGSYHSLLRVALDSLILSSVLSCRIHSNVEK